MKSLQNYFAVKLAIGLAVVAGAAPAQQFVVSTIAGVPTVQNYYGDGASALIAQLYQPQRVAVDKNGNYYIADFYTNAVRMVTLSTGNISTIVGTGVRGYSGDNDTATMATLADVHGLAVDASGNVYFSDTSNSRIRKVDVAKGTVSLFAGTGDQGYTGDGKAATSAAVWSPAGLAFDSAGNLYVADYGNSTVRKITSSGTISTVAGTGTWGMSGDGGPANKATLAAPVSLAIDAAGNIYIGDVSSQSIRKVTTDGNIRTIATGIAPQSLAVDAAGNLYSVDGLSSVIQKILPNGTVLTIAGQPNNPGFSGDGGAANQAQFNFVSGIAIDSKGNLLVADTKNQVIRQLSPVPFSIGTVTSAAASSVQNAVAPGEIVTLYGTGIGPATLTTFTVSNGSIGNQIANTQVFFNGIPAPLVYASSNLVAAIAPYGLANAASADIAVKYQGNVSATTTVPVATAAPAIFTADSTGSGQAAAVNADGSLNSASKPAKTGTFISLYITGDGQTNPGGTDGKLANAAPYPLTVLPVSATVGGKSAIVNYAGATPTAVAGLTQVNVQIPAGITTGSAVPVTITVGSVAAQSGVTISVQ